MADKKTLRQKYRRLRSELPLAEAEAKSVGICRAIAASEEFAAARTVHTFLPIARLREINTYPLLQALFAAGKTAVVSVSDFDRGTMPCYEITPDTLLWENGFGIPEPQCAGHLTPVDPADIDLIVVPLLAYDPCGARVGYGKGFYDRFFRLCRPDAVKAGVSFFPPENRRIEGITPDDIPLDLCFTPQGKQTFHP